jgi:gluconolactonase
MGIAVIDPVAEKYVAKIHMGLAISNIAFGDNNDVFITGSGHVWKLKRSDI